MIKTYYLAKIIHKMQIPSFHYCDIHPTSRASSGCTLTEVTMGRYSYCGDKTSITNVEIGSFCSIGRDCSIGGGVHPAHMVSTSPVFLRGRNILRKNYAAHPYSPSEKVYIGNDVWIGNGVFIKSGVSIGDGAIIGAHAVVTHDIEPYSVVVGVPGKVIKKRFDDETVQKFLKLRWWDWPEDRLEEYAKYFVNPNELFEALEE